MALTSAQKCTLRTDMDTHPELTTAIANADLAAIAAFYNEDAPGGDTCWRPTMSVYEVKQQIVWTEYLSTSVTEKSTFELIISNGEIQSSDPNIRGGIADIFAGPQLAQTRQNLLAAAQRVMTRLELLFADTAQSPATLVVEGSLSQSDVLWALDNC